MIKYLQFNEEFKRSLVAQIDSGAISKAAATREHEISPSLLDRWQQQIHEGTMQSRPTARERQLERELNRNKKKVGELTIQNELLKKLNETSASVRRSSGYVVTGPTTGQSKRGANDRPERIHILLPATGIPKAERTDRRRFAGQDRVATGHYFIAFLID
jgi:transposase-like protein